MKRILILIFILPGYFTTGQIIYLKDANTKQPIEYATLLSQSPEAFTTTNLAGEADVSAFTGSDHIEIRMLGYKTEFLSYAMFTRSDRIIYLKPSGISLDQIVVSATRGHALKKDVPFKILLLSAQENSMQNPQTQADLLDLTGHVFIQKSQLGGGSPMIRGFSANRLLYSVDGIRMNSAIFRGGNLQNVISLDPFATAKTEIIMGPASVMYGSDAIGGAMNFETLLPQLAYNRKSILSGSGTVRFTTANFEKTGHFDINFGTKKWASVSSVTYRDFNDLKMGSHGPDNYLRPFYVTTEGTTDIINVNPDPRLQVPSGYSQLNLMQKVLFKPNPFWDISYAIHYSETSSYSRYDRLIRTKNNQPASAEWYYGPQGWLMNNLSVTNQNKCLWYDGLVVHLAQQNFKESRIDRSFNKTERNKKFENVNAYSLNADLNKTIGTKNVINYGLEAVYNKVKSTATDENIVTGTETSGAPRYPMANWYSFALYLSDKFKWTDHTTVLTGIRYNWFKSDATFNQSFYPFPFTHASVEQGALTGNLGLVYRPTDKWIFRTNLATGFRAPNVDDMGKVFDSEPGSVVVPNPDLRPEYAYNCDVSIARIFNPFFEIEVTGYYTILKNAMVRRNFSLNGKDSIIYSGSLSRVQALQNAAEARIFGIEADFEASLGKGLGLNGHINYQKGIEELDDKSTSPSRHAPPMFGSLHLTYGTTRLKFDAYGVFNAAKNFDDMPEEEKGKAYMYALDKNGNPWSPGWITANFKITYHLTETISANCGIENITDVRYRPYSSGISSAGRNFIVSVKRKF